MKKDVHTLRNRPTMQDDQSYFEDTEIIARVLGGDVNAFESLLVMYGDRVLKIVREHVPYEQAVETVLAC
jgi:hypothetical protein